MIYNTKSHKLQNVLKCLQSSQSWWICSIGFPINVFTYSLNGYSFWGDPPFWLAWDSGVSGDTVFCAKTRTVLGKSGWLVTLYTLSIIYLECTDSVINLNNFTALCWLYTLNYKKEEKEKDSSIMKVLRFLFKMFYCSFDS